MKRIKKNVDVFLKSFTAKEKKKSAKRARFALALTNFFERRSPYAFFEKLSGALLAHSKKRGALNAAQKSGAHSCSEKVVKVLDASFSSNFPRQLLCRAKWDSASKFHCYFIYFETHTELRSFKIDIELFFFPRIFAFCTESTVHGRKCFNWLSLV